MISQKLLKILACPKCKGPLKQTADENEISCEKCKLLYPVREDIPVTLIEEARTME